MRWVLMSICQTNWVGPCRIRALDDGVAIAFGYRAAGTAMSSAVTAVWSLPRSAIRALVAWSAVTVRSETIESGYWCRTGSVFASHLVFLTRTSFWFRT